MKKGFILLLFLATHLIVAQESNHYNFWNRMAIATPITKQLKAELEIQNRWQNDMYDNNTKWVEAQLMNSFRLWSYYQLNEKICFIASPFGYFENNPIIKNEGDESKAKIYENRYSLLMEIKERLFQKTYVINKFGIEYRDFKNWSPDYFRFREKLSVRYELNSKWALVTYDELFINTTNKNGIHEFDQNRIGLMVNLNPIKSLKLELGYMLNTRSQKNSTTNLQENNFVLNTYYTLPNKKIK